MESQRQPPGKIPFGTPEEEADGAIKYVSKQEQEPVIPTGPQLEQMIELAKKYPGERFRAAVRAFAKDHPWNSQTYASNRWSFFVNGFPGYDVMKTVADEAAARKVEESEIIARIDRLHYWKAPLVGSFAFEGDTYRANEYFTDEDKAFLEQVRKADYLEELPSNIEQRSAELRARIARLIKEQDERGSEDFGLSQEIPSQRTAALDEVKQS